MEKQFKNLAICGGGVLGLSLTTAFKAMNNLNKMESIEKVCGTSVGSMFGVFVACKLNNKEIDHYTKKFYNQLTELDENVIQEGINMINNLGLHDNTNIYKAINELLFEKYGIHHMTLKQLFDTTNVEYTAVTMCMDTRKAVYLNHKSYPDLPVGKAVQMSSAVPFFFVQVKVNGMTFVDGGAVDNMPIDYYDCANGEFNELTLGIHFKHSEIPKNYESDSVLKLLEGIESTQIETNEKKSIQNYSMRNIIEIDVGKVDSFNFNLSDDEKELLLKSGYNSVISYFAKLENDKKQKEKQEKQTKQDEQIKQRTWTEWAESWTKSWT